MARQAAIRDGSVTAPVSYPHGFPQHLEMAVEIFQGDFSQNASIFVF
jgi:hypothetical protein